MKLARVYAAVVVFAFAVLPATSGAAASGPWVTLTDKYEGFSLTVPKSMYFVPNSVSKVKAIISQLTEQNQAGVAAVYSQIIASSDVTRFVYEGFFYTPKAAVQPLFTLAVATTAPVNTTGSGLAKIAKGSAASLRRQLYDVTAAKVVALPEGSAALDEATLDRNNVKSLVVIYTVGHGNRIYQLTFRTDATSKASLATFETVAKRLAFG